MFYIWVFYHYQYVHFVQLFYLSLSHSSLFVPVYADWDSFSVFLYSVFWLIYCTSMYLFGVSVNFAGLYDWVFSPYTKSASNLTENSENISIVQLVWENNQDVENPRSVFFPGNRCQHLYNRRIETIRSCQLFIRRYYSDTVLCICRLSISLGLGFTPRPAVFLTLDVR